MSVKIFGFEIRKFEQSSTSIEVVETWCVKWSSLYNNSIGRGMQEINVQAFPTEHGANAYAKELTDARRLLGDQGFPVEVYKQKIPTNASR